MKKLILLPIVILIMTFGMTSNVYASTCTGIYNAGYTPLLNQTSTLTKGLNTIDVALDNSITWNANSPYNTLESKMWYVITDSQNNSYYSNIDLQQTCSHYTWSSQTGQAMTIYYQNGSTAQINANSMGFPICDTYNSLGQLYQVQQYEPNITSIGIALMVNSTPIVCSVDNNGNFSCPKQAYNITFDKVRFYFALEKKETTNVKFGVISRNWNWCTSDTQQIINNQNQNATQQHNDSNAINNNITNTYNFISDSNIDNNTNADNISSQYNSTSSNNVLNLLLIPINFIQTIINGFNDTCTQVCIGQCPSGGGIHDNAWFFIFPCIDLQGLLGSTLYNVIDALMCFAMIFAFIRSVVGFFKKALLLELDVGTEVSIIS